MASLYHHFSLRYKYLSRVFRSEMLRWFFRILLPFFALERNVRSVHTKSGIRILVIVIGGMGDCLLFDSLFRRLKEKWPDATIDVLTGFFENMWERFDSVDNVYYLTATRFKPPWKYLNLFRKIYLKKYDIVSEGIAMLPPRGIYPVFTSLVFEASKAPVRIGRKTLGLRKLMRIGIDGFRTNETCGENPHLTHVIKLLPPSERQYHESAKVFEPLGLNYYRKKDEPRLRSNLQQDKWAEKLLCDQWASHNDIIIGFSIETTRKIKSWPVEKFLSLLELGIRDNLKFVMIGLEKQSSTSPFKTFARDDLLNLSGLTTLGEMISVIRQCNFFLSCDTGPAHIAQAYRIPTVVLFGPSNEMEFGPVDYDLHSLVLPPKDPGCRPCVLGPCIKENSCMNLIQPETVYRELKKKIEMLSGNNNKPEIKPHNPPKVLYTI